MSRSNHRPLLCMFATVVASQIVAVAGGFVVREVVPHSILTSGSEVAGNYLQTLGAVYGVLLAFVVFVVWTQKNEAGKLVEQEADGLRDLVRLARAMGGKDQLKILHAIDAYSVAVIQHEWPAMQKRSFSPEASQRLRELWDIIELIDPDCLRTQCLYAETIRSFNALGNSRADRLVNSNTRLPISLRIFVVAGGICTVASMYLFSIDRYLPLAIMIAVMAGAVSHILYLIHDLDTPYGDWQVTTDPIERVRDKVQRELRELTDAAKEPAIAQANGNP